THTGFSRLLGDRFVREQPDPDFPAALDRTGHRHASRFDLAIRNPAALHRLQPVVAERQCRAAPRFAGHPPALLLAVLYFLRHQHRLTPSCLLRALLPRVSILSNSASAEALPWAAESDRPNANPYRRAQPASR